MDRMPFTSPPIPAILLICEGMKILLRRATLAGWLNLANKARLSFENGMAPALAPLLLLLMLLLSLLLPPPSLPPTPNITPEGGWAILAPAAAAALFLILVLDRFEDASVNHDVSETPIHLSNMRSEETMKQKTRNTCAESFMCLDDRQP